MSSLIFRRFFEIRILHEYNFVQADGTSIFDSKQDNWASVLAEKIKTNQYDIQNYLEIEPTESCKKILANFHLKLIINPTGFIVGIETKTDRITPKISFTKPMVFQFLMRIKSPHFNSFTTEPIDQKSYYFSNRPLQLQRSRKSPILSNKIADFTKGKIYSTGELARKSGKLQIARKTTKSENANDWMALSEQSSEYAYVNSQDMCQFTQRTFQYQAREPIKKIVAKLLTDGSNKPLKTISLNFESTVQRVSLDFVEDDKNNKIEDGVYLLVTKCNGKGEESSMIYFSDTLAALRPYALIEISTDKADDFSVMTTKNSIRKNHRIFDILFKSRATYWRYRSTNRKKLSKPEGFNFLKEENLDLITVDPRVLSAESSSFQRTINNVSTTVFLPSPEAANIQLGNDVFYSDVFVSKV